jgi:maltoporin
MKCHCLSVLAGVPRAVRLLAGALALLSSASARAGLEDRLEFSMYGRVGVAWGSSGNFVQGRSMNLTGSSLGGRLEEGDYLEPSIKLHLLKPKEDDPESAYAYTVVTPAMWANNGLFIALTSNRFSQTLALELGEAYGVMGNVLVPGLKIWGGARFYRGTNVYLADYWYFNNLSAQGVGAQYKGFDVALLLQTSANLPQYTLDTDGDGQPDARRQRTVLVGQYAHTFESGHSAQLLTELHALPRTTAALPDGEHELPSDIGWVAGIKGHLNLGNDSFNDMSVRYGNRIANGGLGGSPTWVTFGSAAPNGKYGKAFGIEVVNHFLYNFNPLVSLNAYGILHANRGASGASEDRSLDFAIGAQSTLYLHSQFHLISEASFQGLRKGLDPLGSAVKLSLVPTFVPTGQRSVWARPHLRLFYTLALYNQQAKEQLYSPYLQTVGPTSVGHFLGARVEWWI